MPELSAQEAEVYRLVEEARSQYERYLSTVQFPLPPEIQNEEIGNYDWRHPVTICTSGR
jgi:hypothetical protein